MLLETTTSEMCKLYRWCDRDKVSLNMNKTKCYLVSVKRVQLQIDGVDTERVSEKEFLEVIKDDKTSWKSHINQTFKKHFCTE